MSIVIESPETALFRHGVVAWLPDRSGPANPTIVRGFSAASSEGDQFGSRWALIHHGDGRREASDLGLGSASADERES